MSISIPCRAVRPGGTTRDAFFQPVRDAVPPASGINIFNLGYVKICKEIGVCPLGRHLFARGLLPFSNRRHVFLRGLLLNFSTCTCKSPHNGLIYTKKGGTRPPLLFSVPQRYNFFRRKARSVKIAHGYGACGPRKHSTGTGKATREGGFVFFFPHAEHFFGISAYLCPK